MHGCALSGLPTEKLGVRTYLNTAHLVDNTHRKPNAECNAKCSGYTGHWALPGMLLVSCICHRARLAAGFGAAARSSKGIMAATMVRDEQGKSRKGGCALSGPPAKKLGVRTCLDPADVLGHYTQVAKHRV